MGINVYKIGNKASERRYDYILNASHFLHLLVFKLQGYY
jgi:hypothetical protein